MARRRPASNPSPSTDALTQPLSEEAMRDLKEAAQCVPESTHLPLALQAELIQTLVLLAADVQKQRPPPWVLAASMHSAISDFENTFPHDLDQPWLMRLRHLDRMLEPFRNDPEPTAE